MRRGGSTNPLTPVRPPSLRNAADGMGDDEETK